MKKAITICAAGLFLASCGTKTIVVEKVPETAAPVITQAPRTESPENKYMNEVSAEYPYEVSKMGKKLVVDFAYTVCESINQGLTVESLARMAMDNGVDAGMVGFMTGSAIRNICPENQWFIDSIN